MTEYTFDGHTLKSRDGSEVAEIDGTIVRDAHGSRIGRIDGKYIRDEQDHRIGNFDGELIHDKSGHWVATIADAKRAISGGGGISLVALYLLRVR